MLCGRAAQPEVLGFEAGNIKREFEPIGIEMIQTWHFIAQT